MQPSQSNFTLLIREAYQRWGEKQPKFFIIANWAMAILGFLTGIPAFLSEFAIILPPHWAAIVLKVVSAASFGAMIMGKLTAKSTTDKDGYTKENLPYTKKTSGETPPVPPIKPLIQEDISPQP